MKITPHVELPEEVVSAAVEGKLVLFVGAGASFGAPTNLPSFDELVGQVAMTVGEDFKPPQPADVFLGNLIDKTPAIREQVRAIIGDPASSPNATHEAIVRVATASAVPRLVTTNYDEHLSTAADVLGLELGDRFNAPAVPLGRDFSGIVYLHGALTRPATEWILTDSDFGRGYLTDGWARQFVMSVFQTFTVLFIGYSHEDPVMSYLARGLPPSTNRYVLTHEPDSHKWVSLQIAPIEYPPDDDHAALPAALNAWADRLSMGALNHRERVRDIVAGGPPKSPVDIDYLVQQLSTPVGVRAFAETAKDPAWIDWISTHPRFNDVFAPGRSESDSTRILSEWFARTYFSDASVLPFGLSVLAKRGPVIGESLMQDLIFTAHGSRTDDPALWLKVMTLTTSALRIDGSDPDGLRTMLYQAPLTSSNVLPFIRQALRPRLVLKESLRWWTLDDEEEGAAPPDVTAEVAWSSGKHDISELLSVATTDLANTAASLFQILEQSLRQAYELRHNFEPARSFDKLSFRRSAIEPHSQDDGREFEDPVIDALRESAQLVATTDPRLADRLLSDEVPLIRRLGVHLLRIDDRRTADAKVDAILGCSRIFDLDARHEVFLLLAEVSQYLTTIARERLLNATLKGPADSPSEKDERLRRWMIFDVLEWISRTVAGWTELDKEIAGILATEPDMGVREHPDMTHWMSSGSWGEALPMSVPDFLKLMDEVGAEAALRNLLGRGYSEREFGEPTWDDALSVLRKTASEDPPRGEELLIAAETLTPFDTTQLVAAIVSGWAQATLTDDNLGQIVTRLAPYVATEALTRSLSDLVRSSVGQGIEARPSALLQRLGKLAEQLWAICQMSPEPERDSEDWTFDGLNTAPGFLAQFWINRVRIRWRAEEPTWTGLDDAERQALSAMLHDATPTGRGPLAIIAGDVRFLHAADREFAVGEVFPQFEPTANGAPQAWGAYLYHPRASDGMLDDGFWALLIEGGASVQALPHRRLEGQYQSLLASVAVYSTAPSVDRQVLMTSLSSGDTKALSEFLDALATVLAEAEPTTQNGSWDTWLRTAMHDRSTAIATTSEERTAWGDFALRLPFALTDALALTSTAPGPLSSHTRFSDIPEAVLKANAEQVAAEVERRLRLTPAAEWHLEHELAELMPRLAAAAVSRDILRAIADAALAIGIHSAAHWPTESA